MVFPPYITSLLLSFAPHLLTEVHFAIYNIQTLNLISVYRSYELRKQVVAILCIKVIFVILHYSEQYVVLSIGENIFQAYTMYYYAFALASLSLSLSLLGTIACSKFAPLKLTLLIILYRLTILHVAVSQIVI